MLRKLSLLGVLVSASASFAGFSVMATPTTVAGFTRWDVIAVNTGGDTGTQIKGLEYFYNGPAAAFQVDDLSDAAGGDPDGIPDTVNLLSQTRTRIRVSTTGPNNVFVGVSPDNGTVQPNPYLNGVGTFQGAIANLGVTNATGAGFQIARIFHPANSFGGVFSGNIGGDVGSKVPFSVWLGGEIGVQLSISPNIVNVDVSTPGVHNAGPVSLFASGNFDGPVTSITRTGGTLDALADNYVETVLSADQSIVMLNNLNYSDLGTYQLTYTARTVSGGTDSKVLTINITPEPGTLLGSCLAMVTSKRRRLV